ncbi:MAG TPA: 50S ribosomal protein L23 [Nitrospinae bacterium]|uniref:Large ribosomal subunit protein uL23 n=1 Tax=uncultured bacterium Rifle_16ft_4_minimus_4190 TaxID=1665159 RepID=A0A0H4TC86_9BACT|nr:50S ribosomal protein L23, large subunit ribosomal protein L23 [uncultured bacterium Rifle_16ft_4_minimus_4190]HAP66304.1 50S ribosomal protein L23 [Nitrospinota bacterium]
MKDIYAVIKKPIITERSAYLKERGNKIIFQVEVNANKRDIKKAVEKVFNVHVMDVNTLNVKGKVKRFGKSFGKRPDWKKAIVTLKEGDKIELLEGI